MNWHFNPYLLAPLFSAALTAALAWFGWRKRPATGAAAFALTMLASALWALFNALELGAADLPAKIFWLKFEYLGIVLLPPAWLVFALQYTGRIERLSRRAMLMLAIEPLTILLLLWTNDFHHLMFRHFGVRQSGILLAWDNLEGPFYWLNIAYAEGFVLLGIFFLLQYFSRLPFSESKREWVVAIGSLLPTFGNILYNLYDIPIPGLDPTPFLLALTGLAFAWGLFSQRLLDVRPAPAALPQELPAWRLRVLEGILRGVLLIWLFALASGIYNVIDAYRQEIASSPHLVFVAVGTIVLYVSVTLLVALITFLRRLSYALRAGAFLFVLYLLGTVGLALASLSGDGRVFLFAFVVLSAIFFGLRFGLFAAGLSLLTLIGMGWLQVSGRIVVPPERQINSTDASAWVSGSIVFLILSAAALISITYLMRALEHNLRHLRESLSREQRLTSILRTVSSVNQVIVRERDPLRLLQQACELLIAGRGYNFAWIGLLQADGVTLKAVAAAGADVNLEQSASRLDLAPGTPTCAVNALRARRPLRIPEDDDPCEACPILCRHPQRLSLALPLLYEGRGLGALVVDHAAPPAFFDEQETALLAELADDLAHALAALYAEEQQRLLAELSAGLLFARDEDMLWTEVIAAVQKVLRAERVAIYFYDRETDRLSCPRWYGLSDEYVREVNRRFHEAPGSAVLREPRPVVVQNVESDPAAAPLREWMLREGFRSYAVFPFYTSKGMIGAFTAYRNAPGVFTASDLTAGEMLVRMIGLALENMNLIAETRRKASELGALYAAAQEMASSLLDSNALLLVLARHVTEALNATSAYISSVNLEERTMRVISEYWSEHASLSERKSDLNRVIPLEDYPAFCRTLTYSKAEVLHDDSPNLSEAERLQFEEYGVRSILFIPIMAHGKMLGGLEVWESRRRREFTPAEIILAQAMAAHAASILESAQLFEKLEQNEARFRALIENAADGIAILESDATFRYFSPSVERILGYRPDELLGRSPFEFVHPEDTQALMAAFAEGVSDPDRIMRVEFRFRSHTGEWLYLEAIAHNLLHNPAVRGVVVNYRDMTARRLAEVRLEQAYDSTLEGWARALELRDELTEGHTRRVTDLTLKLARRLGLSEERLVHIRRGAILHDIGKMGIPDSILHKPGPLTAEEEAIMRQHPQLAYDMLRRIEFLRPALDIPYCHHEKWDGTGYPRRLKGEEIPLAARLFAIADVYDALTSDRPYRPAWSRESTLEHIRSQAGSYFDPSLVRLFLEMMQEEGK